MVRCRHNRHEDHTRVSDPNQHVDAFPDCGLPNFAFLESAPEDTGVVEHGAADDEGVAEMHGRHGGKRIDVITTHPDAGCVVVANGVQKSILWREEARRHAGIQGESHKSEEVGEGESTADGGEGWV